MDAIRLFENLPIEHHSGEADPSISALTDDSRRVIPGALFIARSGSLKDGQQYIQDAVSKGASAILCHEPVDMPGNVSVFLCSDTPAQLPMLASRFYGFNPARLKLLGVTGTNGKTTVAYLTRQLLNVMGMKCGMIGTIEIDNGQEVIPADLTTPGVIDMARILSEAIANGCKAMVMECSSHALDQGRVNWLRYAAAAYTNLSGDHLDYHKTMEKYAQAKAQLFSLVQSEGLSVINIDDAYAPIMQAATQASVICYGETPEAELQYTIEEIGVESMSFLLHINGERKQIQMGLGGPHNVANLMAAIGLGMGVRLPMDEILRHVPSLKAAPGRLEPVRVNESQTFNVLVDYAHTDDALLNVVKALKPLAVNRLITLFGCGGDRDTTKRPRMCRVACEHSDVVMITSDNPRTEDAAKIIDDIQAGIPEGTSAVVMTEIDRVIAIKNCIQMAEPGDIVLLAGKGHEDYQIIGTQKIHLDDREQALRVLEDLL